MGTVDALSREEVSLTDAIAAYEATLAGPESAATLRSYRAVLRPLAAELGPGAAVAALEIRQVAEGRGITMWSRPHAVCTARARRLRRLRGGCCC